MEINTNEIKNMGYKLNEYNTVYYQIFQIIKKQNLNIEKEYKEEFQNIILNLKNKIKAYKLGNEAYRSKLDAMY